MFVWGLGDGGRLETLASSGVPDETAGRFGVYPLELGGLVSDAMTGRWLVAVGSGEEYDARYPALAKERRRLGAESLVALPLRTGRGEVIGAIFAASTAELGDRGTAPAAPRHRRADGRRARARALQADAERAAEADAFLALFGESLERATTASGRARRLVEELARRASDVRGGPPRQTRKEVAEIASAGSRPAELADEDAGGVDRRGGLDGEGGRRGRARPGATGGSGRRPSSSCRCGRAGGVSAL